MMVKEGSTRFYLPLSTTVPPSHIAGETVASDESTDSTEQFEHETEHLDEDHLEDEHHTNTINDEDFHTESAYPDEELHMEEVRHSIGEEDIPVEQKLRQITEEIEKYSNSDKVDENNSRQSFFSLSDLIKTLRPNDKKVAPQIDSDYSNTMRVLGEPKVENVNSEAVVFETSPVHQQNRALFKK